MTSTTQRRRFKYVGGSEVTIYKPKDLALITEQTRSVIFYGIETVLDLPNTVTSLEINSLKITSITNLQNSNTHLSLLQIPDCPLILPTSLIYLKCHYSSRTSLPDLPNTIETLDIQRNNNLQTLPKLPESLWQLECNNNNLTALPDLPNSLAILKCGNNNLTLLPDLPTSLTKLYCNNNKLTTLPDLYRLHSLKNLNCYDNKLTTTPILPNNPWLELNLKNNPITDELYKLPVREIIAWQQSHQVYTPKQEAEYLERRAKDKEISIQIRQRPLITSIEETTGDGINPITRVNTDVNEWLTFDTDNIVVQLNGINYCVKRSYFRPEKIVPYALLSECIYDNTGGLTPDTAVFVDLAKFGIANGGLVLVDDLSIFQALERNRFLVSIGKPIPIISLMLVQCSNIRNPEFKTTHKSSIPLPNNLSIYLNDYSLKWDARMNGYLRFNGTDKDFLDVNINSKYSDDDEDIDISSFDYERFAKTPEEGLRIIREKIWFLDYIFNTYGDVRSEPFTVYRATTGDRTDYSGLNFGFISTSSCFSGCLSFGENRYEYIVEPGVPFVLLKKYNKYFNEDEVLLPRGLTTTKIDGNDFKMRVTMTTPDQYRVNYKCTSLPHSTIA